MNVQETAEATVAVVTDETWNRQVAELRDKGLREAARLRRQGRRFLPVIVAPTTARGSGKSVIAAAELVLDWKIAAKQEIVALFRDLLTKMDMIGAMDPSLAPVLAALMEEKGLFEYNVGEFYLLYGKFEERYDVVKGADVSAKMVELLQGDRSCFKVYRDRGSERSGPLPYVVRNALSHIGNNSTTVTRLELRQSVDLLKSWTSA